MASIWVVRFSIEVHLGQVLLYVMVSGGAIYWLAGAMPLQ
jgi:hypothetical protein